MTFDSQDFLTTALQECREEVLRGVEDKMIKIHNEVGEEWSDAEYRSNYMSTILSSIKPLTKPTL